MTLYIAPIVEGHTEQGCLEPLLQRVCGQLLTLPERIQVQEPFRGHRDSLVHANGLELTNTVNKAFIKLTAKMKKDATARPLVLILLDAEGDCPATLAPRLLTVARDALPPNTPISCVLAKRMFENWIVAGASTLAGKNGLPNSLPERDKFEERNGAAWLGAQIHSQNPKRNASARMPRQLSLVRQTLSGSAGLFP